MWVALRWRMATPAGGTPTLHVEALVASNLWALAADAAQRAEREPMSPGDGTRITGVVRCPTRGIALGGGGRSCPVVVLVSVEGQAGEPIEARVKPLCVVLAARGSSEWTVEGGVVQACLQAPCELRWGVVQ